MFVHEEDWCWFQVHYQNHYDVCIFKWIFLGSCNSLDVTIKKIIDVDVVNILSEISEWIGLKIGWYQSQLD
jgi:hypothetical protein